MKIFENLLGYAVYYLLMAGVWIGETLEEWEEKNDATSRSLPEMQKYYKVDEASHSTKKILQAPQESVVPFPVSRLPR